MQVGKKKGGFNTLEFFHNREVKYSGGKVSTVHMKKKYLVAIGF